MVKLIAGHTERMLVEHVMERSGADCPSVMCVFVCERLENKKNTTE